jgi:uncharacterized glyoxalase superfamily metalloenzyme YdcJ
MAVTRAWELRAAFARRLSQMFGREVPAYATLVEVSHEVNDWVLRRDGAHAERLGSISRVTAERHGAIRVGTPDELRQVAAIFGAMGMVPVGFYDLREAVPSPVPVVSTAFRPVEPAELARNPFRVFTSMLAVEDPRFFDARLRARLRRFLAVRQLFPPELIALAERARQAGGLPQEQAQRFLQLAVSAFELSREPIDAAWYAELSRVSGVAADIGGVRSTHLNHLTPRVLDIDELYRRMTDRSIRMIDRIQGPPRWSGPDVLLRQTSFQALAEPRPMRAADGTVSTGSLRVRFGEVEARGIALTRAGRGRYDELLARSAGSDELARQLWEQHVPRTERALADQALGYFTYHPVEHPGQPPATLAELLEGGWVRPEPIVYEDFLPASAAAIFQSNLGGEGARDDQKSAVHYDSAWLSGAIGQDIADPFDLYQAQQDRSLDHVRQILDLPDLKGWP